MKKSTKTLTGSLAALASVASIIAPAATVLAEGQTAVQVAGDHVAYAEKTLNFFDWNLAFGKVVALGDKEPQYFELLARLAKIENTVKTPEIKAVLTAMDSLAANKDLTNFYNIMDLSKNVANANDMNYLLNELNDWGKTAVFTPEVVAATDAIMNAWTLKTPESIAAAKAAAAKLTAAGNLSWVNAQISEVEATMPLSTQASAVGAKKLQVKFNKAVDTTKAAITVNKGTSNIAVTNVTYSADKLSAVIELSSKMTEGKYSVKVAGLADAALVSDVTVENESVNKIEILSNTAVLDRDADTEVTVGYQVLNQYGEKITNHPTLVVTSSKGTGVATGGVLTLTAGSDYSVGDKLAVTIVESTSAKFVSGELTVAAESKVAEVAPVGLLNEDVEAVTTIAQEDNADDFYLEVTAKDQYGSDITDEAILTDDLIATSSSPSVVDVVLDGNSKPVFDTLTDEDDNDHLALKLDVKDSYGSAVITLISKSTGKSVQYKVTVTEKVKLDTVKVGAPEVSLVAGGDTILLPLEVADNKGAAITAADDVTLDDAGTANVVEGVKFAVTGGTFNEIVEKDGALYAEILVGSFASAGTLVVTATTETGKVDTEIVQVKETAVPDAIIGLSEDTQKTIFKGESVTLGWSDLVLQDQYGREFDQEERTIPAAFSFTVEKADSENTVVTVTPGADAATVTADAKGTAVLTFTLTDADGDVDDSSTDVTFRTVELSELSKFDAEISGKLYANSTSDVTDDYAKELKVFGLTSNGEKVYLPQIQGLNAIYDVIESSSYVTFDTIDGYGYVDGVEKLTDGNVDDVENYNDDIEYTGTAKLTIVINDNGYEFTKTIDVSEAAPVVDKVEYVVDDESVDTIEVAPGAFNVASLTNIVVTDDYGVENVGLNVVDRLTISGVVNNDGEDAPVITNNGKVAAAISGLEAGDSFKATVVIDGKTLTLTVNVAE